MTRPGPQHQSHVYYVRVQDFAGRVFTVRRPDGSCSFMRPEAARDYVIEHLGGLIGCEWSVERFPARERGNFLPSGRGFGPAPTTKDQS